MNPDSMVLTLPFAEIAAGTDEVWYVPVPVTGTFRVDAIRFTPWTARTAHDTNFTDLSVEIAGTEIASERTTTADTGNLVAGTSIALALTASGKSLEVSGPTGSITVKKTDAASGLALDGCVAIHLTAIRS